MRTSAALAILGIVSVLAQHFWAPVNVPQPWGFGPLIVGLLALAGSFAIGLPRGTRLYRIAVVVAVASLLTVLAALTPFGGSPGPRPSPTRGEILLAMSVLLAALAVALGAVAIWNDRDSSAPVPA